MECFSEDVTLEER